MKTCARVLALTAAMAVAVPPSAWAQRNDAPSGLHLAGPAPGDEILVTYVSGRNGPAALQAMRTVRMELVALEAGRLIGRLRGDLVVVDARSVRSVKRRIGTKPASAPAMAMGSAAGFLAGFALGALAHQDQPGRLGDRSAVDDGLVAGVLIGAPLGAITAWVVSRSRPIYENIGMGRAVPGVWVSPSGQVDVTLTFPIR